jgi:DNA polymerase elongation subunit (family B)
MSEQILSEELIEKFLEGHDPQKYIVGIEATNFSNEVTLIINDPVEGKYLEKHKFRPFIWLKHKVALQLYGGDRGKIKKAMARWGVSIKALRTEDGNGNIPDRIENGFKFIATCNGSYSDLQQFFKQGGVDTYSSGSERLFFNLSAEEQFLIQTGKRLFKGMDDYDDIHRLQYDLETTGLYKKKDRIFQIGIRDNRGFETVLEVKSDLAERLLFDGRTPTEEESRHIEKELRKSEAEVITQFFEIIDSLKPDVITGYNSENFDFDFIYGRCEVLYLDITKIAKTLNKDVKIFRKNSTLKLGQETEHYEQTYMWGYNILDIMHAVRKAQAINSDIKKSGLKYITKFSNVAKKNRVYVPGDKIFETWSSFDKHYFNDVDGDWFKFNSNNSDHQLKIDSNKYQEVSGAYIVQRYLLDDLWETEQIDNIFNQATFLVSKILPTSFMRAATMGTAGTWKLIMAAWSYENNLTVPDYEPKREFTGGLSRLLEVGYAKDVVKLDFAALYPKTQLTHGIVPKLDISGVMPYLLTYIVDTRDKYKFMTGDEKTLAKELSNKLEAERDNMTAEEIAELEAKITKHKKLSSDYDKKQLPLKILANSFFGSFGAPYLFPWGEIDAAEETTCRGRQYLRLMVKHFSQKYGFRPLVGDTDGFNFAIPDNVDTITYVCKANHWKTDKYEAGTVLRGLEAVLAEFNEEYMIGRMGLDIDDICNSTINFARKNYANDIDGKIKLVGNSIKSKTMPAYIEEFLDKGIRLLLDGKGYEFIEYYYEYVNQIFNYEIPIAKIATKKRIKQTIDEYVNVYCKTKTKAGQLKSRQAHMELAIQDNLNVNLGDTLYYVNTSDVKSHGDIKATKDKKTGKTIITLNCKIIPSEQIEDNPNLTTKEYNVPKYLEAFNKRISGLLVCFHPDIRNQILINVYKDKKTKEIMLDTRPYFTEKQCILDSGHPNEAKDQDDFERDLMTMEDKEIRFWSSTGKIPNNMSEEEFRQIESDWKERVRQARIDGIKEQKQRLDEIFKRFEVDDIEGLKTVGVLPKSILSFADVGEHKQHGAGFFSIEYNTWLCKLEDIFKYEDIAIQRAEFYTQHPELFVKLKRGQTKYDIWLEYIQNEEKENGPKERFNPLCTEKLCCSEHWSGQCPCYNQFGGDKDKLNQYLDKLAAEESRANMNDAITAVTQFNENVKKTEVIEMEPETNQKLDEVKEKLKDKVLFPKKIERANEILSSTTLPSAGKITMKDVLDCDDCDEDEWNF